QIEVEAFDLRGLVDPQTHQGLHDHQDHEGGDGAPDDGRDDAVDLQGHLRHVAFEEASRSADRLDREDACQNGPDDAADAVDAEYVEAVVIAQRPLHHG